MLNQIKTILESDKRIKHWTVFDQHRNGHQLYTSMGQQEAIRAVEQKRWQINIKIDVPSSNGARLLGETDIEIAQGETNIKGRINSAVEQAGLHGSPAYIPPSPAAQYPDYNNVDPDIRDNPWGTLTRLKEELQEAVSIEPDIEVASSEFFIDHTALHMINSEGADLNEEASKLTWDICLLYNNGKDDTEFWEMKFRPGAYSINVKEDIARYAKYARDAAVARVPRSGTCPVVLTGDHLYILLQYFMHHSHAGAKYNGSSLFEPGQRVLPGEPVGDPLSIFSNAIHPGGTRTYKFDPEGLPGQRIPIIENGFLKQFWSSAQHAQHLGIDATGTFGDFEIPAGNVSWDDLFKSNDRVILVQQFSTFDPQPIAGNYLGEIRVGYEFRADGTVVPLRGGSVTGNVVNGMLNCQFCRERETFYGYYGPRGIRFEHAQVAGE